MGKQSQRAGRSHSGNLADSVEEISFLRLGKAEVDNLLITNAVRDEQPCRGALS
jgi:hypothetical protein